MNNLSELDKQNIWHPFTPLEGAADPIVITSASGIYLHTFDGRAIIDAISSWWVTIHGHSNPHIAKSIFDQASLLEHVIFAGFTHAPAITLSKNILSILPDNQKKIFFSDNGSTAVEVALKLALQYWHNLGLPRKKIIALEGSYHGDTFGAMSVGSRGIFTAPFSRHLFDVSFIPFPNANNEEDVLTQFLNLLSDDVAAFIFEPLVQGAAGMRMYRADFLDRLVAEAQNQGVLCIADEVFTGFGRTGELFASHYLNNNPDIFALSKGLTGGAMPLGVTSCSSKIVDAFLSEELEKTFFHGHSFTANPIACSAANASFELLLKDECQKNIKQIAEAHTAFIRRIEGNSKLRDARTLGTILAIELLHEDESTYINPLRKKIYSFFLKRNILLRPLGNVIYIVPPYIIKSHELESIYQAIEEFLETL